MNEITAKLFRWCKANLITVTLETISAKNEPGYAQYFVLTLTNAMLKNGVTPCRQGKTVDEAAKGIVSYIDRFGIDMEVQVTANVVVPHAWSTFERDNKLASDPARHEVNVGDWTLDTIVYDDDDWASRCNRMADSEEMVRSKFDQSVEHYAKQKLRVAGMAFKGDRYIYLPNEETYKDAVHLLNVDRV